MKGQAESENEVIYDHSGLCISCTSFTPSNQSFGVCERHHKTIHCLGKCDDYVSKNKKQNKPIQNTLKPTEEKPAPPPKTGSLF